MATCLLMSVLRYCCFRWLVYDRALVFEPSRPLACIMMLVWLILFVELCCDIFPWVPDLDRTHFRAWLNRGRHKLVSEPTACRNPPSNSLAEVESKLYKTFTNMAVRPMGPRRHWVVLGSFTPRSLLWDSELSSIRVKRFLLKSDFRFSKILSPGEPLQSRWSPATPEDFEVTRRNSFETLCPLPLQFPTIKISLWINTYTWRSYFYSQLILLLQDTPKFSLLIREYLVPTVLQFLVTWIPLRIILALVEYPLIPSCSCVSQKSSK